ncbi:hypothetical protein N7495_007398 [Penicillium taxi]|uniref:uncharacterized protein n=1 Tax=Penicillium taxi TaxID=168475 RepID=UPI0025459163|nr:uncharacterized protein N7495_007398 [Penicillium taxi]KAJ5887357.1 hypothetical protein N7495_007398 [Penicillium taxi]
MSLWPVSRETSLSFLLPASRILQPASRALPPASVSRLLSGKDPCDWRAVVGHRFVGKGESCLDAMKARPTIWSDRLSVNISWLPENRFFRNFAYTSYSRLLSTNLKRLTFVLALLSVTSPFRWCWHPRSLVRKSPLSELYDNGKGRGYAGFHF